MISKIQRRNKIKARIRGKISGTAARPRLCVFRSNKQIYAQVIDDVAANTVVSASSKGITEGTKSLPRLVKLWLIRPLKKVLKQ